MTLIDSTSQSEALIQWLDRQIDGTEVSADLRSRVAGGCLDVALEHQKAIILMVARSLSGSAFALRRLMFEAYVRGVWLHQCASETEIEQFESELLDRTFGSILSDIEKLEAFKQGTLSAVKQSSWKAMNSYTHTGFMQVVRRNKTYTIEPNYDEQEIIEVLDFADGTGIMSAVEIAHLAGNEPLSLALLKKAKEIEKFRSNNRHQSDAATSHV